MGASTRAVASGLAAATSANSAARRGGAAGSGTRAGARRQGQGDRLLGAAEVGFGRRGADPRTPPARPGPQREGSGGQPHGAVFDRYDSAGPRCTDSTKAASRWSSFEAGSERLKK